MSAPHFHALNAIVFELVATLERYEADVDALVRQWPDTRRYDTVRKHMDDLQMFSSSVSCVAGAAVSVLIAHSELMFTLWRADLQSNWQDAEFERVCASHRASVASLRHQCLRELSRHEHATLM